MLNERGIPNPTEYKRLQGIRYRQPKGKGSTLWKYFAISNMLTNEIYIGNMVQGKYGSISYKTKQNKPRPKEEWIRTEGTHEPIIEQELWERVQKMLAERAKPFPIRNNRAVCAEGALCGMWLHAAFLENQGEILSAMPQSSHFQGELQGGVYFCGAAGADGFAGITYDFRCLSELG